MRTASEIVFACRQAACRPPTSGGTGGSNSKGGGTAQAEATLKAKFTRTVPSRGSATKSRALPGQEVSRSGGGLTVHTRYQVQPKGKQFEVVDTKRGNKVVNRFNNEKGALDEADRRARPDG